MVASRAGVLAMRQRTSSTRRPTPSGTLLVASSLTDNGNRAPPASGLKTQVYFIVSGLFASCGMDAQDGCTCGPKSYPPPPHPHLHGVVRVLWSCPCHAGSNNQCQSPSAASQNGLAMEQRLGDQVLAPSRGMSCAASRDGPALEQRFRATASRQRLSDQLPTPARKARAALRGGLAMEQRLGDQLLAPSRGM